MRRNIRELGLLVILSAIATYFGLSLCYQLVTQPERSYGLFENIARDGWIVDGSAILPPYLSERGNRLHVDFHDWRPAGVDPAHLKVYLCGELIDEFVVREAHTRTFFLTGSCEPRVLRFEVVNPFIASPTDQRELGIQLKEVRIDSRIGYPILQWWVYLQVFLCIFLLALLWYLCWFSSSLRHLAILIPGLGFLLVQSAIYMRLFKIYPVWIFFTFLFLGILAFRIFAVLEARMEVRELKPAKHFIWIVLLLVLLLGGALRFTGLSFGLPAHFHPDEVAKLNAIMRMVEQGTLDPQYFLHPSLLLYSTYLFNSVFHAIGIFQGEFRDTVILAGRTVSASAGTFALLFVYLIGKRLFSSPAGLVGAALLAVSPLHIASSRYLKEDALLLFFILAAIWALLKAVQEDRKGYLFLAAAFAGFSVSVKYSGLLTAGIVASAPWLRSRRFLPDKSYLAWTGLALIVVPVAFVFGTPYSVLNAEKFIADFNYERMHMKRGHTIAIDAWSQYWAYHLERSIFPGLTTLPTLFALIGMGFLACRRRTEDLFLLGLILLYYLPAEYVRAKPAPQPERYIYPCLPFLTLAAGVVFERMIRIKRLWLKALCCLLLLVTFLQPLYRSATLASEISYDTREKMADWMRGHIPAGSRVYVDLRAYNSQFFEDEFEIIYARPAVVHQNLTREQLVAKEYDYLLLSSLWWDRYFSQPRSDAPVKHILREVFRTIPIIKEFAPRYGGYGFHNPIITLFQLDREAIKELDRELELKKAGELLMTSNEKKTAFYGFQEVLDY